MRKGANMFEQSLWERELLSWLPWMSECHGNGRCHGFSTLGYHRGFVPSQKVDSHIKFLHSPSLVAGFSDVSRLGKHPRVLRNIWHQQEHTVMQCQNWDVSLGVLLLCLDILAKTPCPRISKQSDKIMILCPVGMQMLGRGSITRMPQFWGANLWISTSMSTACLSIPSCQVLLHFFSRTWPTEYMHSVLKWTLSAPQTLAR